jgi:acyl-CoA thioester hydrolase
MTGEAVEPADGRFAGREHRFPVRVFFEDTDLSGVVYHANYLRFMERARSAMLAAAGIDQRGAWEGGEGAYTIASLAIRYLAPARLGEALTVASRLIRLRAASVLIQQRVMRGSALLAEADVSAAFVAPGGRPRRQPAAWLGLFAPLVWEG